MYRKEKRRSAALYIGAGAAVVICLAVIAFLVWSMAMKNSYRALCLEINDAILATPIEDCAIGCGGDEYPADKGVLDYYDRFLLEERIMPFSRKTVPADDRTITLTLGDNRLLLTGVGDGTAVNVAWATPAGSRSYTVRSGSIFFSQLRAYYTNYAHRVSAGGN